MVIPIQVDVLEVNSRQSKDGDKTYHNLICYQPGCKWPELISASIEPSEMQIAQSLVGERGIQVRLEQSTYNGRNRYAFLGLAQ